MGKNQNQYYQKLYDAWKKSNNLKKGDELQREVNAFWAENKSNLNIIRTKIMELDKQVREQVSKPSSLRQWLEQPSVPKPKTSTTFHAEVNILPSTSIQTVNEEAEVHAGPVNQRIRLAPKQEALAEAIAEINEKIARFEVLKQNRVASTEDVLQLSKCLKKKRQLETELRRKKNLLINSQRQRDKNKKNFEQFKQNHPDIAPELEAAVTSRNIVGRPRIHNEDMLLKTIVDIVAPEASADIGRRTELLRACTTLDDLKVEVEKRIQGMTISRSALYLRLQPRNCTTVEGKRHIKTVPVKLLRAQNMKRKVHEDDHFAAALHRQFKDLAELMGSDVSIVIRQDDKARVHMGLPAATKQAPILMALKYRMTLPDHDYVVAPRHKLIPSVYACLTFKDRKLSYSGPTFIAIRSGKHDKSSAETHGHDLRSFLRDSKFEQNFKTKTGDIKPLVFVFSDGGPDENPRYSKVIEETSVTFRTLNLDAMFVSTHAPGQSAYNPVERRMAPLSRDLSGVILPHDAYGTHLDHNKKTIDNELEIKNFAKAGETLAEIWNENMIDKHPVTAEYIAPGTGTDKEVDRSWLTEKWKSTHIRMGRYCHQIVKCDDLQCCQPFRSNLRHVLRGGFLPTPVKYQSSDVGPIPCTSSKQPGYFGSLHERITLSNLDPEWKDARPIPFDFYCPSVEADLENGFCTACNGYFVTKVRLAAHKKAMHVSSVESIIETINEVVENYTEFSAEAQADNITIITDLQAWLRSEFTDADE